ncbi:PREDICTED: cytosolic Fe-S cluster assembly factor NUBP1 homolog [Bactrocera latifrons]|uniref:Cytosolic Fe-S cluster assembly factor NUBP1 homolog n=1 Tax=Bactrocera latifrons TaxID=174628 RepID=A0A0K8V8H0_BACLA|nr:PREDICTED: cytosolic Fe-S cluster assembly factor NUBP1 homolog [Bactrocera latifrons]
MEAEPENCPGVGTENAGKSSACAGCPNQALCSDPNTKFEDPGKALVAEAMREVKQKLLILSGKGGVGKSTVTTLLSRYLSRKYPEHNFGVLDVDICGPSQPRLLGVEGENVHQSGSGWSPVGVDDNLCLMSIGFLLGSQDDAIIWRGPKKNGMIRQFLSEVDWGKLDLLLLDTPPGTSDEHLSIVSYLRNNEAPDSLKALIVTTPQEASLLDVRKEINFCKKQNLPILGVIENMSAFRCSCGETSEIFPAKTGGAAAMCSEMNVPYLGALPLDPEVTKACDLGEDLTNITNSTTDALVSICQKIIETLEIKEVY